MKSKLTALLLLALTSGCVSTLPVDIVKLPPPAKPGQGAYLSGDLIFPLDAKPTPSCHASTIVETPSGLVVAWFGGTQEKNPDVGIHVSRLADGIWTKPVEVADGSEGEDKQYPCWNPVLFQPKNGPLMLFYKVGPVRAGGGAFCYSQRMTARAGAIAVNWAGTTRLVI